MSWAVPRVIRGNRGDIASRYGILTALANRRTAITALFAARPTHVPGPAAAVEILPYGPLYNLWPGWRGIKALRQSRAVIWTGGLDLQDDSSLIKLVHTWLIFLSFRLLGLRILLAHQGAGPLVTRTGRWLARRILACVELALLRDRGSFRVLAALTAPERLRLAADGIFLEGFLEGFSGRDAPSGSDLGLLHETRDRPVIGLNIRLWYHFAGSFVPYQFARERYLRRAQAPMGQLLDALEHVIGELRRRHQARIVLVSMYEPDTEAWEDDAPLLQALKRRFAADDEVVMFADDVPIEEFCRLLGRFDLMIGMRLHSTLIALRAGVPAVHIAYTLKGHDIYADLGLTDWVVDIEEARRSPDALTQVVERVLSDPQRFERVAGSVSPLVSANTAALADAVSAIEHG